MIKKSLHGGFTIIELIVVLTLVMILVSLMFINITPLPAKFSQKSAKDLLISDIKSQQVKAMSGEAGGGGSADSYGVHFNNTNYVLFKGENYIEGNAENFTVGLEENTAIQNTSFPAGNLIFSKGSGEVAGYLEGSSSFDVVNIQTLEGETVRINKYGAVY